MSKESTRPDTRPSVADGWAGAEMKLSATKNVLKRSFPHFSTRVHGPTDRRTDGPTDRRTDKASYRVACPQLKTVKFENCIIEEFTPSSGIDIVDVVRKHVCTKVTCTCLFGLNPFDLINNCVARNFIRCCTILKLSHHKVHQADMNKEII